MDTLDVLRRSGRGWPTRSNDNLRVSLHVFGQLDSDIHPPGPVDQAREPERVNYEALNRETRKSPSPDRFSWGRNADLFGR